ncbi:hypothetical protein H0H92_001689 [Tricholoma furcatifolium]|nr:hypothetical protein H0H92_001689 [Tricholoma furcatifolium]
MSPPSSEQSFRNNLSQFRWARGNTDDSQPAPQPAGNPFSRFYNTIAGDYIPLRSSERSNEDEAWFALSSWESFSVLIGPINHIKHLISADRLPFSTIYFSSLGLTLYFSLVAHSFFGSLISAIVQVVALVAYVLAYFPGGTTTLRLGGSLALRGAGSLLPR